MKGCAKDRDLFALLDGELKERSRTALLSHLASCPPCAERCDRLAALRQAAGEALPSRPESWNRIDARVERALSETLDSRSESRRASLAPLGLAAAAAAFAVVALLLSPLEEKISSDETQAPRIAAAKRAAGSAPPVRSVETQRPFPVVRLVDQLGCEIRPRRIEPGSSVTTDSGGTARLSIDGETRIEIADNSSVRLDALAPWAAFLSLQRGSMLVEHPAGSSTRELLVLAGGEVLEVLEGLVEISLADDALEIRVVNGAVRARGEGDGALMTLGTWRATEPDPGAEPRWKRNEIDSGSDVRTEPLEERRWEDPSGTLPRRVVREALYRIKPRIRRCYENALKRFPTIDLDLEARLRIDPRGAVTRVRLGGAEAWPDLNVCLVGVLSELSYPPPRGGAVEIIYPLRLSPHP
ncbi:MAG: AgmX/PglI C-terminal domain-containing protein [Polyangia bacterium]